MFPISCDCPNAQYRYTDLAGMGPGVRVGQPQGPWRAGYLSTLSGAADQLRRQAALDRRESASLPPRVQEAAGLLTDPEQKLDQIVDQDPGVVNAKGALEQALASFQRQHPMSYTVYKYRYSRNPSNRSYPAGTGYSGYIDGKWQGDPDQIKQLKKRTEQILRAAQRVRQARKAVLERVSNSIPYKGHVIKPVIEGDGVRYRVTFNISKETGVFSSPEEAKAAIDNEVAFGPGGLEAKEAFEKRAQEVGEQQAAQEIVRRRQAAQAPQMSAGVQAQAPTTKGLSTGAKVGIAAAAVGGAFLLMK